MKAKYFFNPFERVAGWQALLAGLVMMLLTASLALVSGLRFDGVLDAHFGEHVEWWRVFADQGINWISLVVVFYPGALLFSRSHTRFIDIAGTMALARTPMLVAAIAGLPSRLSDFISQLPNANGTTLFSTPDFWVTVVLALLMVWGTIWSAILIYNAWRVSANVKGTRAGVVYGFGLLIAEIGSKILIANI
ncbi:MAG: hypothetical protein CVU06_06100 [Bacteroidetes bacterium HGW-Bacteroidetes-22]|nr:MAG: hypothetical protein CVU06_06100 [Bacteroidetes bacterium HGW-Bacteroidetes-22]